MSTAEVRGNQPTFWQCQFGPRPTVGQVAFDITFGVALPLVCFYFDPIVFRAGTGGGGFLGEYFIVAAVATGLGWVSLFAWLLLGRPPAILAGLLVGGAIFAALLGLVLLPLSLIGLTMLIGILGFTPLLTAFVFWRNAFRAYQWARGDGCEATTAAQAAVGLFVACAGPWLVHWYVTREISSATSMVISADPTDAARGLEVLKRFRVFTTFDQLAIAYEQEENAERRERLGRSYKELTGEDITQRLSILRD